MNSGVRAACVVVAFHDPVSLERLLAGLDHPTLEVIVVNVGSDPAISGVTREHGAHELTVDGNPGYAAAVNRAVAAISAPVTVFMNDDVAADSVTVLALAGVVERGEADVAVPAVNRADGGLERTIAALPTPRALAWEWLLLPDRPLWPPSGRRKVEKWRAPTTPQRIEAAAAVMVATRTDLLRCQPLPESYFLYWEESEWFWRLRERGAVVVYRPDVAVTHEGGRSEVRPEKSRLLARNAVRCVRRTQGRRSAAVAIPIVVAWNLRLVAVAALSRQRRPLLRSRLAGLGTALGSWRELKVRP